jgi:hypothetical protein
MKIYSAALAVVSLVAMVGFVLSFIATVMITLRLNVLADRLRMPFVQRLRYMWAGPLSMWLMRDHANEQMRRWARWLAPAVVLTLAFGLVFFSGMTVLGLPM